MTSIHFPKGISTIEQPQLDEANTRRQSSTHGSRGLCRAAVVLT